MGPNSSANIKQKPIARCYSRPIVGGVIFAFGSQPGLPEQDALDLAELLMRTRSLAGVSASGKIIKQAECDADKAEFGENVELDPEELLVLDLVLDEEPWPREQTWFEHLRDEVRQVRGRP